LKAFPRRKVKKIARLIDEGPGFQNAAAQQRFAQRLRAWAYVMFSCNFTPPRRPAPETRKALRAIARAAEKLERQVRLLPEPGRTMLMDSLPVGHSDLQIRPMHVAAHNKRRRESVVRDIRQIDMVNELRRLAEGANQAACFQAARGAPGNPYRQPLRGLATIWQLHTGERPTVPRDPYDDSCRYGPFRDFAYAALTAVWPDIGSVDGLLDEICTEFAAREPI
jgi:hypothetical protein